MAKIDLTSQEWCDLIFEGRNKDYGAYKMRARAARRLNFSVVLVIVIAAVGFSIPRLITMVTPEKTAPVIKKDEEVADEDQMKTQEELTESKVAISIADIQGTDEEGGELVEDLKQVVTEAPVEEEVFNMVEQAPQFPGGQAELMAYLSKNIHYPVIAQENGIQGSVVCQFVVGSDGSIRDIVVARSLDPSCDKEAVRVIQSMPKWIPGRQNGKAVSVRYTLPVRFRLQ